MTTGLILIDIQNDYFPGGRMELFHADETGAHARLLLEAARERTIPIIHIQHLATTPTASFFIPGTPGSEIHQIVSPESEEEVVQKNFPNSFRATNLQDILIRYGIDHLIICGMMTHMCIDTTVRAAFDLGYRCSLAADACTTRDLIWSEETIPAAQVQASFLAALSGVFAEVMSTHDILVKIFPNL
ncbi:MAG: cysteine hydrolase family protein [Methanobacteriota archaeon]